MTKPRRKRIHPFRGTPYQAARLDFRVTCVLFDTLEHLKFHNADEIPEGGISPACTLTSLSECEIHFCRDCIREDFIAHEATHTALSVMKANSGRNQIIIGHDEELLAYLVGSITRQIVQWFDIVLQD